MAFSRKSVALLCVCIGLLLLVDASVAQEQLQKADNAGSTTEQFYLRGDTVGAMTQGPPLTEDMIEESLDSFGDYGTTPATANCRPKPCRP